MTEVNSKRCNICKQVKPLSEYAILRRSPDGYQNKCKSCDKVYRDKHKEEARIYSVQYRQDNYDQIHRQKKQYRVENRDRIAAGKREIYWEFARKVVLYMGAKCELCGLETDWYEVYHCHHRNPEEKDSQITNMMHKNWETEAIPEMRKCILLCTECHNVLTQQTMRSKPNKHHDNLVRDKRLDARKWKCVEYLGGKCEICGRVHVDLPRYEFHHVDPSTKSFTITNRRSLSFENLIPELNKCVVLCGNCHRSYTFGRYPDLVFVPGARSLNKDRLISLAL
jgi:hypothetical protein